MTSNDFRNKAPVAALSNLAAKGPFINYIDNYGRGFTKNVNIFIHNVLWFKLENECGGSQKFCQRSL